MFDRNSYQWVDRGDNEPEYSYFTTVSDIRVEEIHPCNKPLIIIIFFFVSRQIGSQSSKREEVLERDKCVRCVETGNS